MNINIAVAARKIFGKTGASRIILKQVEFFQNRSANLHIYTSRINKKNFNSSVKIKKFFSLYPKKEKRRILYAENFKPFCHKNNIDIAIGHGDTFFQDILFMHNIVELEYKVSGIQRIEDSIIYKVHNKILREKRFKLLINNSIMMKNYFFSKYEIPEERSFVLYPGHDESLFNTENLSDIRNNFRKKYNIKEKFVIGFITSGNFFKRGLDIFFDAISMLSEDILQKTRIIVIGCKKDVLQFIKNYSLFKFLTIIEPFENIEEFYKSIDLMVHPARIEEFGMVVLEAMACGVPVITSKMVGASEIYKGDLQELLMDRSKSELIAEKISKIINQKDSLNYYRKLSKDCANQYTWKSYMEGLTDICKLKGVLPEKF